MCLTPFLRPFSVFRSERSSTDRPIRGSISHHRISRINKIWFSGYSEVTKTTVRMFHYSEFIIPSNGYLVNSAPPGLFPYPRLSGGRGDGGLGYGGSWVRPPPPCYLDNHGRIEPRQATFESSPQDLPKAYLRF